ncbi:MAG: peptide chain release factor 2, partial [Eubacteriaceae bacterium]|nr:peptide chain release factor 2 [Eubacteriaceae bacterium]
NAEKAVKSLNAKKQKAGDLRKLESMAEDVEVLLDLALEDGSDETLLEASQSLESLKKESQSYFVKTLLSGEYDQNNAILSIHPGAGGTESQDWAEMLMRMYLRYGERSGYKVTTLDYLEGDVAGVKSVAFLFQGAYAYGYLKAEKGVHRLVRISPFDSQSRRHTSFASVDVMPELDSSIEIDIDPQDLRIDTYRSSGAGGQHVNKTESAVRITHIPTGIVVACQNERSQFQNKDVAMKMLYAKLMELMIAENKEKISDLQGDYGQIAWGNQIRSYVFQPYTMVKDHRTSEETGNVQAVMDGELQSFVDAWLKKEMGK